MLRLLWSLLRLIWRSSFLRITALVCSRETGSILKLFSSELSCSLYSNWFTFFEERHTDAKWIFFLLLTLTARLLERRTFSSSILHDFVYNHHTVYAIRKDSWNVFSSFSSRHLTILIHLSCYDDSLTSFPVSKFVDVFCILVSGGFVSSSFAAKGFHSLCTFLWLSGDSGIFLLSKHHALLSICTILCFFRLPFQLHTKKSTQSFNYFFGDGNVTSPHNCLCVVKAYLTEGEVMVLGR